MLRSHLLQTAISHLCLKSPLLGHPVRLGWGGEVRTCLLDELLKGRIELQGPNQFVIYQSKETLGIICFKAFFYDSGAQKMSNHGPSYEKSHRVQTSEDTTDYSISFYLDSDSWGPLKTTSGEPWMTKEVLKET